MRRRALRLRCFLHLLVAQRLHPEPSRTTLLRVQPQRRQLLLDASLGCSSSLECTQTLALATGSPEVVLAVARLAPARYLPADGLLDTAGSRCCTGVLAWCLRAQGCGQTATKTEVTCSRVFRMYLVLHSQAHVVTLTALGIAQLSGLHA